MKHIKRYTIQDENGAEYASFIDHKIAFEWVEDANTGRLIKHGWDGNTYSVIEKSVEISKNTGTLFF